MYPLRDFLIVRQIPNATDATDQIAFIAPFDCKLVAVEARWQTASSSGTLAIEKVPDGTAVGSGTDLLTATMDLSATADTKITGAISRAAGVNYIRKGQGVSFDFGGTVTNLVDLLVTLTFRQLKLRG